jgi:sensor c-di-GMP phosphodiesterase-like protein
LRLRWKIAAIIAGIMLAGAPMAAFNFWLNGLIQRQGQDEVDLSARRSIVLAESRTHRVLAVLEDLIARGVDSCGTGQIQALRRATFQATPIKELSLVGADGQTLCNDLGISLGARKVVGSQALAKPRDAAFEVLLVGDRAERMVRIRRQLPGGHSIAALVPSELFVGQVSTNGATMQAHMRTTLRDGTLVGEAGALPMSRAGADLFSTTRKSDRFDLSVAASLPKSSVADGGLRDLGFVVTGVFALLIGGFTLLLPRRQKDNPVAEIERALKDGEFIPFYQPIVDITSGRLRGAEVLIRWRKPDGSLIAPAAFIPLAESSGLIVEMTRHLMRKVRDEISAAYERRPQLRIGFNLAASHFADDRVVGDVRRIFERSPIQYSQIVLELTERQPVENLTAARRVIAAIQGLGAKVAIDDVGAGHSGLSYMLKLGVDVIKIDKIFVDAMGSDNDSMHIIDTLVDLAKNMRMEIVAEGVENFEQAVALRNHGIRSAQGYLFAPPLPSASFLKLVEAIEPVNSQPVAAAA